MLSYYFHARNCKYFELNIKTIWYYKWLNNLHKEGKNNYNESVNKWRNIYIILIKLSILTCFFRLIFTIIKKRSFSLIYNILIMLANALGFIGIAKSPFILFLIIYIKDDYILNYIAYWIIYINVYNFWRINYSFNCYYGFF